MTTVLETSRNAERLLNFGELARAEPIDGDDLAIREGF
jgi:hypothetical protein